MKAKECTFDGCDNPAFSKGRCKWHMEKKPMKQTSGLTSRAPLKQVSEKRGKQNRAYSAAIKVFKIERNICEVGTPDCTFATEEVHHTKGRENARLLYQHHWLPVCAACHRYIHSHSAEAYKKGWLISK